MIGLYFFQGEAEKKVLSIDGPLCPISICRNLCTQRLIESCNKSSSACRSRLWQSFFFSVDHWINLTLNHLSPSKFVPPSLSPQCLSLPIRGNYHKKSKYQENVQMALIHNSLTKMALERSPFTKYASKKREFPSLGRLALPATLPIISV